MNGILDRTATTIAAVFATTTLQGTRDKSKKN